METQIFLGLEHIEEAAALLKHGELVAFPTETVYGLGACIFDEQAVGKIFTVKGRPSDNPLIAHIANIEEISTLSVDFPQKRLQLLADAFWPGPLTLVVPKKDTVPDIVSAKLPTVAVRMPDHPIALTLIRFAGQPIVAPSANTSTRPSPTTAQHVLDDLRGKIAGVIDGGPCPVGIESTVLDITRSVPLVLRPGFVTREQIKEVLHCDVDLYDPVIHGNEQLNSPGLRYRHYAPNAKVILLKDETEIESLVTSEGKNTLLLSNRRTHSLSELITRHPLSAETLYSELRDADKNNMTLVFILPDETDLQNEGLMNRIRKATG